MAELLDWPFFEASHRELAERARAMVRGQSRPTRTATISTAECRALVRELGERGLPQAVRRRRRTPARRAQPRDRARNARPAFAASPISPSPCRASARARSACSAAIEQKREWLPKVASGEAIAAFAMTEPRMRVGRRQHRMTAAMRDGNEWVLDRREDLHLQRRHRRFLRDLRPHRRRRRRARACPPSSSRPTPGLRVAERIEVIAPHPLARLKYRQCPHAGRRDHRRAGRGLPHRHGDAQPVPGDGRRGGARLRPARARRGARASPRSRRLGSGTLADNAVTQAKLADMALASMPRRC